MTTTTSAQTTEVVAIIESLFSPGEQTALAGFPARVQRPDSRRLSPRPTDAHRLVAAARPAPVPSATRRPRVLRPRHGVPRPSTLGHPTPSAWTATKLARYW